MKKVEAIIRTSKFEEVVEALAAVGVTFLSFYDVKGHGLEKEYQTYRGATYDVGYIPRTKLEIIVSDSFLQKAIDTILNVGRTGKVGDGKIFVTHVEEVYRIRNGEQGTQALN
ncbi:P-II family nitrogen regulator [Catalinimonas niigatensis]|uniref:P-II family nitrogen regulator n=1 Tax=Catalinimonas niigatensis TaxID=1397264 RepID=UPI002665EAFC|nr:P-II family nitrogen regulator [Catalinimonas niigatensis]WPP50115.1 P-II family nitrogen regulator [Catalinimonas niigatensis]